MPSHFQTDRQSSQKTKNEIKKIQHDIKMSSRQFYASILSSITTIFLGFSIYFGYQLPTIEESRAARATAEQEKFNSVILSITSMRDPESKSIALKLANEFYPKYRNLIDRLRSDVLRERLRNVIIQFGSNPYKTINDRIAVEHAVTALINECTFRKNELRVIESLAKFSSARDSLKNSIKKVTSDSNESNDTNSILEAIITKEDALDEITAIGCD